MSVANWAGNVSFGARRLHRPGSVEELCRVVAEADRVRPLGTAHSFNHIADTPGDLVSVAGLPPVVEIDSDRSQVRVAAGLRYGEFAGRLHAAGFALPNLGSLPHISVGGACATATHGSGVGNGNLATAVSALELVTADGSVRTVRRDADPDFPGMVVGLGALGVVTHLTLELVPSFEIRQYVFDGLPHPELFTRFDEVLGLAYSVSLFTDWRHPVVDQVWVKQRGAEPPELPATPADGPRHPVPGMPVENCTQQLGVPGPWHERLPHFRLEFTPSSGEELQTEYFVPRSQALDAFQAVHRLAHLVAPVLHISEIRTIAADDLWLSPCHGRDSVAFHFTWIRDADAVLPVIAAVGDALAPFAPRAHWGKLFVHSGHYDRLPDFRALIERYDPAGKFHNEFLERHVSG
ncbi:MAG TPA: FAD-binding protein [Actinophytocola sp.]|uniref:FAD-binding protein n=1 Tax=Actinophytocola sp. TaxID=1872138 RepID=UPI002DB5895E|nr:FAD-binding protein [Actinophytocola sp.]HEU5471514.1 FAD-binding protein [Actinophytocola sp.]